jgi:ADP-ribose diphosphatase
MTIEKDEKEVLYEGRHLAFLRARGWEYVRHRVAAEAVLVVALTADGCIVLVEEFRPAVGAAVICLPAGLVGDTGPEAPIDAAMRELAEETGFSASDWKFLGRGPGSAGMTSEIVHLFAARDVRQTGEQSIEDRGQILVHRVPLASLSSWAKEREAAGALIDPKVWAGLYLAREIESTGA